MERAVGVERAVREKTKKEAEKTDSDSTAKFIEIVVSFLSILFQCYLTDYLKSNENINSVVNFRRFQLEFCVESFFSEANGMLIEIYRSKQLKTTRYLSVYLT